MALRIKIHWVAWLAFYYTHVTTLIIVCTIKVVLAGSTDHAIKLKSKVLLLYSIFGTFTTAPWLKLQPFFQ